MSSRAWYLLENSGINQWINLLHWPYTLWNLSYVVMGAAIAPVFNWGLLGWTMLAFFLGMGVGAHLLDSVKDNPLRVSIPKAQQLIVASIALVGTLAIALLMASRLSPWIWLFWAIAVWGALAYNLEKPSWMHSDLAFAVLWGAFPVITAYWIQTQVISWSAVGLAIFALLTAYAQRVLSMQSRIIRRRLGGVDISVLYTPGASGGVNDDRSWVNKAFFLNPVDLTLKLLNAGIVLLAAVLLFWRI